MGGDWRRAKSGLRRVAVCVGDWAKLAAALQRESPWPDDANNSQNPWRAFALSAFSALWRVKPALAAFVRDAEGWAALRRGA